MTGAAQGRHQAAAGPAAVAAAAQRVRRLFRGSEQTAGPSFLQVCCAGAQRERREAKVKRSLLLSLLPITLKNERPAEKYLRFF